MTQLYGKIIESNNTTGNKPFLLKLTSNNSLPVNYRKNVGLLNCKIDMNLSGYRAYISTNKNFLSNLPNSYLLEPFLDYLHDGDIIRLNPEQNQVRVLYRKQSPYNALLVTERCNSFCLMCSQPPRKIDDDYIVDDLLVLIPMIDRGALEIGITGGEPTIIGERFFEIIRKLKAYHPETSVHVLSNGRNFDDLLFAKKLREINHPNLMLGIPLYSDISQIHDFVVQADGAFDQTIRGILNLKRCGIRVEIRFVVHKQTYDRMPQFAEFVVRNLTFVDQVVFMGLEITGFTKANLDELWIDPVTYQPELAEAVFTLDRFHIKTSIYNHQLCTLDSRLNKFSVRSISDWKNIYMPECDPCMRKHECGGFFNSSIIRYSKHITPFN